MTTAPGSQLGGMPAKQRVPSCDQDGPRTIGGPARCRCERARQLPEARLLGLGRRQHLRLHTGLALVAAQATMSRCVRDHGDVEVPRTSRWDRLRARFPARCDVSPATVGPPSGETYWSTWTRAADVARSPSATGSDRRCRRMPELGIGDRPSHRRSATPSIGRARYPMSHDRVVPCECRPSRDQVRREPGHLPLRAPVSRPAPAHARTSLPGNRRQPAPCL